MLRKHGFSLSLPNLSGLCSLSNSSSSVMAPFVSEFFMNALSVSFVLTVVNDKETSLMKSERCTGLLIWKYKI